MNAKTIKLLALISTTALVGYGAAAYRHPAKDAAVSASAPALSALAPSAPGTGDAASGEDLAPPEETKAQLSGPLKSDSLAGKYLASHFAQSVNDWAGANEFLGQIIALNTGDTDLIRRSMILATGTGNMVLAAQRARELTATEKGDGLALMILAVDQLSHNNVDLALQSLDQMQAGDMTDFVKPLLRGWAMAARGEYNVDGFNETTIHRYHAALIAVLLDNKDKIRESVESILKMGTLSNSDADRAADLLAVLGRYDEAAKLYQGILQQDDTDGSIAEKLEAVKKENGGNIRELIEPLQIKTAQQGAARAMYDMAYILYQEHSDSSTKLFAQMAIALDPHMTDAHLILADTLTRNGRLEEAIAQLDNIPEDHPSYLAVQRHSAELLAEVGRKDEALAKLNDLFINHNDVESLIRIGDLYRHDENYKNALSAYNRAAEHIGSTIPEEYWYLLYARGMAYEREGDWNKAESDLKAAMVYRPNHPYLLNYLGYGWADQGKNLKESLELIKRAVALQPTDGYIIDSLGWVQYMMKDYADALPNLEKAVELLPYDSTINDHLGDAYWQSGRKVEARFQWERASNYSEDPSFQAQMDHKLRFGLEGLQEVRHADSTPAPDAKAMMQGDRQQ